MRPIVVTTALAAAVFAASTAPALGATFTVTNTNDNGPDSLREAIQGANAKAGADEIKFAIPNVDQFPHVIVPVTDLDQIDERVTIDGYSQPGAVAGRELRIVIDASAVNRGLELATDGSVVRGLVVQNALDDGIRVQGNGNRITGNYVGTDADGILPRGNTGDGIEVTGDGNIVGGSTPQDRNVISDNGDGGVAIVGGENVVLGNAIGTDVRMTQRLGNGNYEGVEVNGGGNRVGGSGAGEGNVISGNGFSGVRVESGTNNEIYGNLLGTDRAGTAAVDGGQDGVRVEEESADNRVGGPAPGEGNLISGSDDGVDLRGDHNVVQGNLIGTTMSGDAALGNNDQGVYVTGDNNTIGGPGDGEGNVISGNGLDGIGIAELSNLDPDDADGNAVQGNLIGTNAQGTAPLPNQGSGVMIANAGPNTIGGLKAGMGNVIAGNGAHGVQILRLHVPPPCPNPPDCLLAPYRYDFDNKVLGNLIGTDVTRRLRLGNNGSGVWIEGGSDNHVGDASEAGANTIAFNGGDGVTVVIGQGRILDGHDNAIERNSIFGNGDLGIDLDDDGPTADDGAEDPDTGSNGLQNYPEFTFDPLLGLLSWTLDSGPSTSFWLEFYANTSCEDPEGRTFLTRVRVTTDAAGHAAGTVDVGQASFVTATATTIAPIDLPPRPPLQREAEPPLLPWENSTSEFSPCLVLKPPIVDH